jgi:hypothetical protein
VIALASELTTDFLIIEFIPREDPMFRRIARGRDELFVDVDQQVFEHVCERTFTVIHSQQLGQTKRRLYLMKPAQVSFSTTPIHPHPKPRFRCRRFFFRLATSWF